MTDDPRLLPSKQIAEDEQPDLERILGCLSRSDRSVIEKLGAEIERLRAVLENSDGCFEAALLEGWLDALANGDIDRIRDIWERRIQMARAALSGDSSAPETGDDLQRLRKIIGDIHEIAGEDRNSDDDTLPERVRRLLTDLRGEIGFTQETSAKRQAGVVCSIHGAFPDFTLCPECPPKASAPPPGGSAYRVRCARCNTEVNLVARDGFVNLHQEGAVGWYFSTETGWLCPADASK